MDGAYLIIATILAAILAITATVLAFIFIVPSKKRNRLNKFGKFLHDTVNFKYLVVEKILQATYILATAFVILYGFFLLFYVQEGYSGYYYSTPARWYGGYGLLMMVLGPIAVRIAYEFVMLALLLVKNVIQINSKLKGDNDGSVDIFAAPVVPTEETVTAAPAQEMSFCRYCGAKMDSGKFCPSCGKEN